VLSEGADAVGMCLRLQKEGHEVRMWVREEQAKHSGEGLVERAETFEHGEIAVADCTGFGAILDAMRSDGRLVFSGSSLHDRLENDRQFSKELFESYGIPTPDSTYLSGPDAWEKAKEIITAYAGETKLVFKPGGNCSGVVPSYVPSDNEDLLKMLEYYKAKMGDTEPEFELQEFHEGICLSTEGWFDGERFMQPFIHTLETKALMNGNLGPSGGCTGNVLWTEEEGPTVEYLLNLAPFLAEHRYTGPIDINCVVGEGGIWALEFTPRFGYDAFPTLLYAMFDGDFGAFVSDVVRGNSPDRMPIREGFGAGVRLTIPPWPKYEMTDGEHLAPKGLPVRGFTMEDLDSFYPYDVCLKGDELISSGGYGCLGVVNGYGDSIGEAFARVYEICHRVKIPDVQFRTDLSEVFQRDYRKLAELLTGQEAKGWYGVDFDKSLATGSGKKLGEPIPKMVERVKGWLRNGREVRIVTARVSPTVDDRHEQEIAIHEWLKEFVGTDLPVTDRKDHEMLRLYDDRVVRLEANTGELE
jgi:phosphoribosylamine---glycine ligase